MSIEAENGKMENLLSSSILSHGSTEEVSHGALI